VRHFISLYQVIGGRSDTLKTMGLCPKPRTRREAAGGGKSTPHQQPGAYCGPTRVK